MRKWTAVAAGVNGTALLVLAACGGGRNYDNPPEVAPLTVVLPSSTIPAPTTTAFVPTTVPSTGPGTTRPQMPTGPSVTAPPATAAPTNPPPATIAERYTVVGGDSFYRIAQRLGVPMNDLLAVNGMHQDSLIQAGDQLAVPAGGQVPGGSGSGTTAAPAPPAGDGGTGGGSGSGDGSGGGGQQTSPPQTNPPGQNSTLPPVPGQVAPANLAASCQAPDSNEADGVTPITFSPSNVLDGDLATAWRCAGGAGAELTFDLGGDVRLTEVGLVGGYVKVDPTSGVDRFVQNRRVRTVEWVFADGTVITQELADSRELQTVPVDVTTASVVLRITDTYAAGGEAPRDFTPVAEVRLVAG